MPLHDDLLKQGPREAPEPETAEERSKRIGLKTAGGGVAAGGIGLAKAGLLGKFFLWFLIWHGAVTAVRLGGLIGVVLVLALVAGFVLYRRQRRREA
jgi:hypothetical protein